MLVKHAWRKEKISDMVCMPSLLKLERWSPFRRSADHSTEKKKKRKAPTFVCDFLSSCTSSWSGRVSSAPLFFFFFNLWYQLHFFCSFFNLSTHLIATSQKADWFTSYCERILTYVCTYIVFFFFWFLCRIPWNEFGARFLFFLTSFFSMSALIVTLFLWSFFFKAFALLFERSRCSRLFCSS